MSLLVALLACGPAPRQTSGDDPEIAQVVRALDAFTFDVYAQSVAGADEDVFVSPFSIAAALSMVHAGAAGTTADEIEAVLHIEDPERHDEAMGALIRDLGGDHRRAYTLSVANRLWGQDGMPWQEPFLTTTRDDYGAELVQREIRGDPEGARGEVNGWVADETRGKIPALFPPGTIGADTVLVLANAIYFKADWADAFDAADTALGTFARLDGSTTEIPLMHGTMLGRWAEGDGFTAARLPYASDETSLWVILPDAPDGLPTVEAALTADGLRATLDGAWTDDLVVTLPRFEVHTQRSLVADLSALGMPTVFTPAADLSGMLDGGGLQIGAALHEAYVRVDEQGTEAAAATGATGILVSADVPKVVTADHPFLFVIRDDVTGALLFVGRIVDPSPVGD